MLLQWRAQTRLRVRARNPFYLDHVAKFFGRLSPHATGGRSREGAAQSEVPEDGAEQVGGEEHARRQRLWRGGRAQLRPRAHAHPSLFL
eukprot:80366-Pleurochrysis_carterae.AAC.1